MFQKAAAALHKYMPYIMCVFIAFATLWKGGKAIDATWFFVGIAWLCSLDYFLNRAHNKHLPHYITIILLSFNAWTILAYAYSLTSNFGLDEVFRTLSGTMVLVWVASRLGNTGERASLFTKLAVTISGSLLIAAVVGTGVYILQAVNRFVGTFFDYRFHTDYWPNAWGDYFLVAWPFMLFYTVNVLHKKKLNRMQRILCTIVLPSFLIATLFLSYSRGSIIAFAGQLFVLAIAYIATHRAIVNVKLCKMYGAIALLTVLFFSGINAIRSQYHEVQSVSQKVTFSASEGFISVNERQQFWQQAVVLIKQRPVFGWGPYSWRFIQPRLQQHVLATADHPHNVFLKLATERGIPAALLFGLLIVIACIIAFLKMLTLKTVAKRNEQHMYICMFVSVAGLIAHNLIDYNLQFVGITLILWLALGVLLTPLANKTQKSVHTSWFIIVSIILLCAFYEAYFIGISSLGRQQFAAGNYVLAAEYFEASKPQWFSRDLHVGLMDIYVRTNQPEKALQTFEEYRTINDQDARAWKLAADAYRLQRDFISAKQYYEHSLMLSLYNDIGTTRWYIQTLLDAGKKKEVVQLRLEFDTLINDFQLAIMNGVHYISLSKNVEELTELLNTMSTVFPESSEKYRGLRAKIIEKSQKDRDFVASRTPGLLW